MSSLPALPTFEAETLPAFAADTIGPVLETPDPIIEHVTPSGLRIVFHDKGHRYKVHLTPDDEGERYTSITTVTKILEKGGLTYWAERVTCEGILELLGNPEFDPRDLDTYGLIRVLREANLDHESVKERAGGRGTDAHTVLQRLFTTGDMGDVSALNEERLAFAHGMHEFHEHVAPNAEVLHSEIMVASVKHKLAGRPDLVLRLRDWTRVRAFIGKRDSLGLIDPTTATHMWLAPGVYLVDAKSGKDIYPNEQFRQVEGYRMLLQDSGYIRPEHGLIVRTNDEGVYECALSTATERDFLDLLTVFRANKEIATNHTRNRKQPDETRFTLDRDQDGRATLPQTAGSES